MRKRKERIRGRRDEEKREAATESREGIKEIIGGTREKNFEIQRQSFDLLSISMNPKISADLDIEGHRKKGRECNEIEKKIWT